jgi:hypothetical protein
MTNVPSSGVYAIPALRQLKDSGASVRVVFSANLTSSELGSVMALVEGAITSLTGDSIVVAGTGCELQIAGLLNAVCNVGKSVSGDITSIAVAIPKKDNPKEAACRITVKVL